MEDGYEVIESYLATIVRMTRSATGDQPILPPYISVDDFILRHGRRWPIQKLGPHMRKGEMKLCYKNSAILSRLTVEPLSYVEGIAYRPGLIPVHHAWVGDKHGNAFDPTWSDAEECFYFGVAFDPKWAYEQMVDRGYFGLLDDVERGFPILRGEIEPVFAEGFGR